VDEKRLGSFEMWCWRRLKKKQLDYSSEKLKKYYAELRRKLIS